MVIRRMLASYAPPPACKGDSDEAANNRRIVLTDITEQIVGFIPRDWRMDRVEVFCEQVYKEILARQFGMTWAKPDVAFKAAKEVFATMTAYDTLPGLPGQGEPGEVSAGFPAFWQHCAKHHERHPSQSPYMTERRRQWQSRYGRWPLEDDVPGPMLGDEPGFADKLPRLRAMVDETLPRVVLGEKSALNELERLIGDFALLGWVEWS